MNLNKIHILLFLYYLRIIKKIFRLLFDIVWIKIKIRIQVSPKIQYRTE